MQYSAIAQEMMHILRTDVEKYCKGEKADYFYQEKISEEYGRTDQNYSNRTRLCYGLFYAEQEIPEKESIIRELFQEEVISRENDSFQGIGVNLELLSIMLRAYEPLDSALFQRAKDANFDCMCGYDPAVYRYQSLENFDLVDYIHMAGDMNLKEYACRFVDEFKKQELTLTQLEQLKSFALYDTKRDSDLEFAVPKIYKFMKDDPDTDKNSYKFQIAIEEYVELLIKKKNFTQALQVFTEHIDSFKENAGSYCILGAELILNDSACEEFVWNRIHPLILEMIQEEEIPVNGCISFAECADRMGNPELSQELRKIYADYLKEREESEEE